MDLFRRTLVNFAVNTVVHTMAAILGLGIAGLGALILMSELKTPPFHTIHIYLAAGFIFFGALLIVPSIVLDGLRQVVVIVGPFLPGGRRATDPPAIKTTPDETKTRHR